MKTRFYILLSMALLLLTQTGCVYDNDRPCGSEDPDLLVIHLNLTVPSSSTGTRSAGDDLVPGNKDEDYINITDKDYQVLLFDKDGVLVEGKLSEFECKENGVNGGETSYTLTTKLSLSGNEDKEKLSKFRVMVLANWKSFENSNTQTDYTYPVFTDYNITPNANKNIFKDEDNFNFTFKELSDNSSWVPSINKKQAIPMFGITEDVDLQFAIDMAKYGDEPSFSVYMLRSLAKIEIVDMVPNVESANIANCVLTTYNTSGRFIPDISGKNSDWSIPASQIEEPSIPNEVATSTNLLFVKDVKTVRTQGATADEEKDCFVVYIPEMEINPTDSPVIQVKLAGSEQIYPITLSGYENGKPKPGTEYTSLLRNHNYRFDIISVGSTELDFLVQTPWQKEDAGEWEYADLKIGFESGKEFTWDFSNYDPETKLPKFESGQLPEQERMVIITQDDWLEGTFKLVSPSQAKWTISLYGDDNTLNDHFNVEIGTKKQENGLDGEVYETKEWTPGGPSVSGNVGEDVLFRIIPTAVNNSNEHYVARVVLTCTTFDDQLIEVNLPYFHNENYKVAGSEMTMPILENNDYYYVKQYYSGFKDVDDNTPERPGGIDGGNDSGGNTGKPDDTQ